MKLKAYILTFFLAGLALTAQAQEGLHVGAVFDGSIVPYSKMQETIIQGPQLIPYQLELYHSLSFDADDTVFAAVEQRVREDMAGASDLRCDQHQGHLVYAVFSLPGHPSGLNQLVCFQTKRQRDTWKITLVYLRGKAQMSDLERMFNKKNN